MGTGQTVREPWSNLGATTIPRALRNACAQWPDKVFLDFSGEKHTFAEADREATRIAHGLAAMGVSKGDRVCSILDNVADLVFVWFAVNKLGAVSVPINTSLKGEYLRHQIADSGAKVVVTEAEYAERVLAVENELPELETLVVRAPTPEVGPARLEVRTLDSLRADDVSSVDVAIAPDDLALLIYTSGTTGPSKGCMVGHSYACNFGRQNAWATRLGPNDILWTPLPLFHAAGAFGVVLASLLIGATAAISIRFSVSNFWSEIEQSRATMAQILSVMLLLVPNAPESEAEKRCHGQLRVVFGTPFGRALQDKWRERFGVKYAASPAYGLTEACMITIVPVDTPNVPDGTSGRRADDFDVRILDEDGNECPPDVPGEIVVRPRKPGIMFQGYWRRPEATIAATRDLWFHTGDMGKFDKNDYFYFVDRKKDYLRRGGENISSFEVEATFLAHPEVREVAVHSVISELSEDEVKVTIALKQGSVLQADVLCEWSIARLPHFAVPRYIEFRDELPKTATGRVQKHVLRSEGVTVATWDRSKSDIVVVKRRSAGNR